MNSKRLNIIKILIFYIGFTICMACGIDIVRASMGQTEIEQRLESYSEWIDTSTEEVKLICPRNDVSENEMFLLVKDISSLLKGVPGDDYCEVAILFPYTVEKYGQDYTSFSGEMFEREDRFAYYITNWSDLNSLNFKVGRKYFGNENFSYTVVVEIVQNGTKDYLNSYAYYEKLQSIVDEGKSKTTTDIELVNFFCSWLEDNVIYDESMSTNSAYVAIMEQRALCGGYANALKDLCSLVGIETMVPTNYPLVHAWSEVYIDGVWYTVDLCKVVKSLSGKMTYEFFFTDPNYSVDYVESYSFIKDEIINSTPILCTSEKITLGSKPYDLSKRIVNLEENASISYTSTNPDIVTVDSKGVITSVNKGNADIIINIKINNRYYTLRQTIQSTYQSADGKDINLKKAKVKLTKVENLKGKKVKVTWKKLTGANGYQIIYARNKKFTKSKKYVYAKKSSKSKSIKKLKKNKTYYFKMRGYIKVDGKKVYSKWSKVKKIKIKR